MRERVYGGLNLVLNGERMSLQELSGEDRLRLIRFVCSFAWADLEMADSEKTFVKNMIGVMDLNADGQAAVTHYLKVPPLPEEIDPTDIPLAHRQLFLNTALQMVGADGHIDERELENLSLFEQPSSKSLLKYWSTYRTATQ